MPSSALGMSAQALSKSIGQSENQSESEWASEYQSEVDARGYQGNYVGMAYYLEAWDLDTPDETIAQDIAGHFFTTLAGEDYWEDFGYGLTHSTWVGEEGQMLGISLVLGLGYVDGNALVTNYINEKRLKVGIRPLEIHPELRRLARTYLAMDDEPSEEQMAGDIQNSLYMRDGRTVRHAYGGCYAPYPVHLVNEDCGLTVHERARAVADTYLQERGDLLLRLDWQHIGIAVGTTLVYPPMKQHSSSLTSEYLMAWRLGPGEERPAHFPRPLEPNEPDTKQERKGKRRWWPF